MNHKTKQSAAAMVSSMVIFGTIGIFRRMIPLPSPVLAFARGIMGSVFLFLLLRVSGRRFDLTAVKKRLVLLMLTGALIGLNWMMLFEAYNYTSIAAATLAYYMQPPLVILASPIFLHEKISLRKGVCVAVAALGMILVSGVLESGAGGSGQLRGIGFGLCAAFLYASVVILNKRVTGVPVYEKTIIQLFFAAVVLLPYLAATGSLHGYDLGLAASLCMITVGILHTGIAYALYFGAIEKLSGQTAAILSYIDPVTAVILSALFLHEPMTVPGMAGAALIIGSAVVSEFRPCAKK
jgi:RarD protein